MICEQGGLEGLKPSFGGGRPSKLTHDQIIELDKIIKNPICQRKFDIFPF